MPNIDVAALVGDIATVSITVRTFGAPTIDQFGRVTASSSDVSRSAVVHNATRRQRERLPSDSRDRETIAIYTNDSPLAPGTAIAGTHVLYDSRWYQVADLGDYGFLGGIYLSLAQLIDVVAPDPP